MTDDQLREYHDALVRIDALVLQLYSALVVARCENTLYDIIETVGGIANRMAEVMPDIVKATRPHGASTDVGGQRGAGPVTAT